MHDFEDKELGSVRLWKIELQRFADETGLALNVHHYFRSRESEFRWIGLR